MKETHTRSVVKGISWRIIGTIDTMVIAFFISGKAIMAVSIGGIEVITKICLFYAHERVWNFIKTKLNTGDRKRISLAKGVTWRMLGTIDTMIISYFITGKIKTAVSIGLVEVVTKIALYFVHERIWLKIPWGKIQESDISVTPENELATSVSGKTI
ncbi:MAG: DUF2061 domain-containing protein [Cytophagaceae bacterium]